MMDAAKILEGYPEKLNCNLRDFWNAQSIDINNKELFEVVGGILARQTTLAIRFSMAVEFWNGEMAPLVLRCMIDNLINLAWMLKEPETRIPMFIGYGLGQEKLMIEHLKEQVKKMGQDSDNVPEIQDMERELSYSRFPMITDVDVGSWSKKSQREMAIECGLEDHYHLGFTPMSSVVHNQWNAIMNHHLIRSENPLHQGLLIPRIENNFTCTFQWVQESTLYLDMAYNRAFESGCFKNPDPWESACEWLTRRLPVDNGIPKASEDSPLKDIE
jgi:hypothetical protein